ncbi:MAG: Gfo/Idh/MocA family oxidoreductase [Alphaproteobacteria bacterium]|nr:Gfo/Idh/MocA family oxidoreductase [Alphaproteobacteria bacterium]
MINFGIIGAGWRSEFYLRIASLVPEKFNITGIYIRNKLKKAEFKNKYNVKICNNLDELIKTKPEFVVSCVNKDGICDMICELCNKGIAVLSETPIGTTPMQIEDFKKKIKPEWTVQVAEQFHFQPRNQAIKAIIDSGNLGEINQVQLSCCHDYHAASLIRFFLDVKDEIPKITSFSFPDKLNVMGGRNGTFEKAEERLSQQKIAVLEYKNKSAIYDFTSEQYFSDIRHSRIIIRGTNGEIINNTCTYLDGVTPVTFDLKRNFCGKNESLDGLYLDSITGNGKILYKNPFYKARLTDEEIAIATCLLKMKDYLLTGTQFYSLYDAITDVKTSLF